MRRVALTDANPNPNPTPGGGPVGVAMVQTGGEVAVIRDVIYLCILLECC